MSKVTMCGRIVLYGNDGSTKNFITQLQYEYTEKDYRVVSAENADKDDKGKKCYHYKYTENNIDFWIPGIYCVEYDEPIGIYNKLGQYDNVIVTEDSLANKMDYERRKFSNEDYAPDVNKQAEFMLGRRIRNRYVADVDMELQRLRISSQKRHKGHEENI